jgi:hypothetical protein
MNNISIIIRILFAVTLFQQNHCPELKKRKGNNLQRRLSRMKETYSFEGNNTLLSSCTYLVCIVFVHILYIYLPKDNMFQEELYLWKNNKIRIVIIIQGKPKS